jgi:hypothetical protein
MVPEDFKQAWQTSTTKHRLTSDRDLLLQEVRRNQQQFDTMILLRDIREVGVGIVLIPIWIVMGWKLAMPWTWWLTLPALFWIVSFMLVDRWRQRRRSNASDEPLKQHVQRSLAQVEHQIWLLGNVFWWYLLPLALPLTAFVIQGAWENRADGWLTVVTLGMVTLIVGAVFAFIYWINKVAVRSGLDPRRQELAILLKALDEESPLSRS